MKRVGEHRRRMSRLIHLDEWLHTKCYEYVQHIWEMSETKLQVPREHIKVKKYIRGEDMGDSPGTISIAWLNKKPVLNTHMIHLSNIAKSSRSRLRSEPLMARSGIGGGGQILTISPHRPPRLCETHDMSYRTSCGLVIDTYAWTCSRDRSEEMVG